MKPLLVFPMAGQSRRFKDAGYTLPKFQLPAHGRPVFDHVLEGFRPYFKSHNFLFITLDQPGIEQFVHDRAFRLGIPADNIRLVALKHPTDGQATTVYEGLLSARISPDTPLTIFNIDTLHHHFHFPETDIMAADGYVEVFHGDGDHWSFARTEADGRVSEMAEKKRISDLCSTGLYHFRRADLFTHVFEDQARRAAATLQGGERYIAPLYNPLIKGGADIRVHIIKRSALTFCGIPEEYEAFLAQQNAP